MTKRLTTRAFSFGTDHKCPFTGINMSFRYVTVKAPNEELCRKLMMTVFGNSWAVEYKTEESLICNANRSASGFGRRSLPMERHMLIEFTADGGRLEMDLPLDTPLDEGEESDRLLTAGEDTPIQ